MKRSGIDHLSDIKNKRHCDIVASTTGGQAVIKGVDSRQINSKHKRDK
jgi:hypothetical protein